MVRVDAPVGHPDFGKFQRCPDCAGPERLARLERISGLNAAELTHRLDQWQAGNWPADDSDRAEKRQQRVIALKCLREAMARLVDNAGGFITFYGDFGSGKSRALTTLANETRLRGVEARYGVFVDLLDHLRDLYARHEPTSALWEAIQQAPLLCVDEVTRFNETGWAAERLFSLVNYRYRERTRLLTVFSTNENPASDDSPANYLYSRMREGKLVELRGDMRPVVGGK